MAKKPIEKQQPDLVQNLATVLSPIARTMIQRDLGAGPLVLAAKLSYLKAAIEEILPPGARTNISRLSVVTGMTRKEITSLLEQQRSDAPSKPRKQQLEQRALKVLRGWMTDPLFQNPLGRPANLDIRGDGRTFASLVRGYGGDVTISAVLKELERMKAVSRSAEGKIRMRSRSLKSNMGYVAQMAEFAVLLRDFSDTASQLVTPAEPPRYFGFRDSIVSTPAQAAHFRRMFSRRAASMLHSVEQWRKRQVSLAPKKGTPRHWPTIRVGVGVYLVQRED